MRTDKYRCERCKRWFSIGDRAVRKHGRLWHVECAIRYQQQRREKVAA